MNKKTFYKLISLLFLPAGLIVSLLFGYSLLGVEQRHLFYPHIDTEFAADFRISNFESIKVGMSQNNVKQILGQPILFGTLSNGYTDDYIKKDFKYFADYSNDGAWSLADFAWEGFEIYYDINKKVISKRRIWYYD